MTPHRPASGHGRPTIEDTRDVGPSDGPLGGPDAECVTIDEVCEWLSLTRPSLDEVATRLRRLIVVKRELDQVIDLLRNHALAELGEPMLRATDPLEEPF